MQVHRLDLSDFNVDYKYENIPLLVTNTLNSVLNLNWKILKAEIDPTMRAFIGTVVKSIVTPMNDAVAIQDLFQGSI